METVFNEIQHSVKNWWTSLLLGIVYIIVALWLMFSPVPRRKARGSRRGSNRRAPSGPRARC